MVKIFLLWHYLGFLGDCFGQFFWPIFVDQLIFWTYSLDRCFGPIFWTNFLDQFFDEQFFWNDFFDCFFFWTWINFLIFRFYLQFLNHCKLDRSTFDLVWKWNQTKFDDVRSVGLSAVLWIRVGSYFGRHLSSNPNKTERWMRVLVLQQKFLSNIRGGLNFDYRQPKIRPLKA